MVERWQVVDVIEKIVKAAEKGIGEGTRRDIEILKQWLIGNTAADYVFVVREDSDKTEGRGPMKDVGVFMTEDAAFECNRHISGVMGHPPQFGGEIWKVEIGYPLRSTKIFGYRQNWLGEWDYGWLDFRDRPTEDDPEWIEYKRLRKKFNPTHQEW